MSFSLIKEVDVMRVIRPFRVANPSYTFDYSDCKIFTTRQSCDLTPFHTALANPSLTYDPRIAAFATYAQLEAYMHSVGVPSNGSRDATKPHGPVATQLIVDEDIKIRSPISWELTRKSPGTMKQFQAARRSGKIVLKPLERFEAVIYDQPVVLNFRPLQTFVSRSGFNSYQQTCSTAGSITGGYPTAVRRGTGRYPDLHGLWYASFVYELGTADGVASSFDLNGYPDLSVIPSHAQAEPQLGNIINSALDENYSGLYDILTELGELPTTLAYVYDVLRRIILAFTGMKSKEALARKKFSGKELVDEIASLWMQFRYAVSPLAYSVSDILDVLKAKDRAYVTTRKRQDQEFTWKVGDYTVRGIMEHRCFVKSRVDPSARTANLGLNPLKTLWELTPLSFVIDWVLPIGELLGGLVPPSHASEVAATYSRRIRAVTIEGPVNYTAKVDYYRVDRITPRPTMFSPDIFLNWKRVIDSMALGWGLFLKQHWKS